ncbi:hypothetical protein JCM3770_001013 [Rhodotorula araucariae]
MSFNPNHFYLPPGGMPQAGMMPQQGYPGQPQPPFNLAALQQQQVPQRNGTSQQQQQQQQAQGFPGMPGMPQQFMGVGGGAPQGMMPPQPPHPAPAGQVNMAAVEQLLRSGQLTQEQFATLAAQIRNHQQQQAQKQAQAVTNASQQQPIAFMGGVPQQQQPQPAMPIPPLSAQSAPPAGSDRIPLQLIQQYSAQLGQVRTLQQKIAMLQTALQTGVVGGQPGADGQGQTRLSPQQRPLVEKQLDETKRQAAGLMQAVQAFQAQWTPQRIQADFQFYQAQRGGQQPQPVPAPQPPQQQQQRPPPPQPSAPAQNLYSSPQQQHAALTAQMLQRQAQAAAVAAAAAGKPAPQNFQPPPQPMQQLPQPGQPTAQQQQQQQQQFMPSPQMMPPPAMPPLHLLQTQLNPQLFMKSLFEVMRKRGEPIDTTPYCDGKEVDLYQLYQAVMVHGGSQQVNQQGTWHRIAAHMGYPADTSMAALRDAPPDTQRVSLELARLYQKMLRPFEDIWGNALVRQQQSILEAQRSGKPLPGVAPPQPQSQSQSQLAPPPRPPSQNGAAGRAAPSAGQLEASRQQLLQQAKAASLAAQQVGAGTPVLAAKQQPNGPSPQQQHPSTTKLNTEPTAEQVAEARHTVAMIKQSIETTRQNLKAINLPEDQKQGVAHLTHELIPHVRKVMETLPLFLAMTGDAVAIRKMLTLAAIFQDQIKYLGSNQFALDLAGLTQLREQFQRCWNFMKSNPLGRASGVAAQGQAQAQAQGQGTSASPLVKPEQFNVVAQGRGLRVEDLKPPPVKHRRTTSGAVASPAPGAPSPSTPQTLAGSPPQSSAGATPVLKPVKAKRAGKKEASGNGGIAGSSPAGASPAATLAALRSDLIKDSPSPMSIVVPPGSAAAAPPPPEEPPALKRKREEDEIERDPDAFIEKTLRALDPSAGAAFDFGLSGAGMGGPGASSGLSLDLDPAIPPVVTDSSAPAPLSFTVLSSADPLSASLAAADTARDGAGAALAEQPFDFDFYIDSSAAGFDTPDDHVDAPTPDLVGGGGSTSAPTPATPADALAATPKAASATLGKSPAKNTVPSPTSASATAGDEFADDVYYSAGGVVVDDVDRWLGGGGGDAGADADAAGKLPASFSWEGVDTPALTASWEFYSEF